MTRDDIIKLAREAGWSGLYTTYNEPTGKADWQMVKESLTIPVTMEQIERFAALVLAAERKACAQVCRDEATRALWNWKNDLPENTNFWNGAEQMAANLANSIDARI